MKTYDEVYQLLCESILARFRVTKDQLKPEAKLMEDLKLDSLDFADLICEIEDRYGQELVPNDDNEIVDAYHKACAGTMRDMTEFLLEIVNKEENKHG